MSMEFGWWNRDPEQGKYQVVATIHGGNLDWKRKQGHHASWQVHVPEEADWIQLLDEANRRVPRRLISPKQMAEIQRICDRRKL
jgi:hypothetical protein